MSEDNTKIKLRVKTVEEAMQVLTALALRADERMDKADERMDSADDRMNGFEAALTSLTPKLEALAAAQIRTEVAMAHLAEAQTHTDQRLDALIDIIRADRESREEPDGK
jgi:ABC-type transporter Mla subunit MlaD